MEFEIDTAVKIKDDHMTRAWGHANELGIIAGPDPQDCSKDIYKVVLLSGPSIFEAKGIHKAHFEVVKALPIN